MSNTRNYLSDGPVPHATEFDAGIGTSTEVLWRQFAETDGLELSALSAHAGLGTCKEYRFAERITNGAVIVLASMISCLPALVA